jgi:ubiquinol-cytochrome c reductase cytochrome c subunit
VPFAVLPAVVLAVVTLARPAPAAQAQPEPEAERIWLADCAVCHGADGTGTQFGVSLARRGRASVDYVLTTGRMPLVIPGRGVRPGRPRQPLPGTQPIEPDRVVTRQAPAYDAGTIRMLVAYVGQLVADGGPPIPVIGPGNIADGGNLFRENCAACHSWSGEGGALLHREAPPLKESTPVQVAEAIRVGPGQMPEFGAAALTHQQLDDLTRYVGYVQDPENRGGLPLAYLGPVAEGAAALLALAFVLWLCVWIGDRA